MFHTKFNIVTWKNYDSCRKKNTETKTAIVVSTSLLVIFRQKSFSTPHITLCHLAVIVSVVQLPQEMTWTNPERFRLVPRIHFLIWYSMAQRTVTLVQRSNISLRFCQAASSEVCVALWYPRYTISPQKVLYILSCPVSTTCEKRIFYKLFNKNIDYENL